MITDKTIYEALSGLLEALPDNIRSRYASLRSAPGKATIDACARILAWDFDRRWVRPALGPSIPLHCSDDFLTECERLASEFDVPLQTHLAESHPWDWLDTARAWWNIWKTLISFRSVSAQPTSSGSATTISRDWHNEASA
jgi:hypothetical protein